MNTNHGGQSMVAPLRRVLLNPPQNANWNLPQQAARWRELRYHHSPVFSLAQAQHDELRRELEACGAEVLDLPQSETFSLDAVYAHDASFITDHGAIILRMGKPGRMLEPQLHVNFFREQGIPILGEIIAPSTIEAGDMVWLDETTLLIGRGYRTNASAIQQVRELLAPFRVEVISAPLPHGAGPEFCLHLMSLMSMLNEDTMLVDSAWLVVETVELLRQRGLRLLEIDASERDSLACNVLALGNGKLLALAENPKTNHKLERAGFKVRTFHGSEVGINGGGGPTCLTRPLWRG
jgi:N-dimethylarginine dimethylaminohydrolase